MLARILRLLTTLVTRIGIDPADSHDVALQKRLLDPLARRVLEGAFREGDSVAVDVSEDELSFVKGHAVHA